MRTGSDSGPVAVAIAAIRQGRPVLVTDHPDRENEGDLVMAAEHVTAAHVSFMMSHCRGLICVPLTTERAEHLGLDPMVRQNTESMRTAFTVSVDAAQGVSTGISAADRAHTIRLLAESRATAGDLVRPGHVFPLIAAAGGVVDRPGHTEAAVDLARLAGCVPVGAICEVADRDGVMLRGARLRRFARRHGLPLCSIDELAAFLRSA
jgi:3,4-dihydroxy 2-butanone 4-phosphate synthase/GTP cyclohydrolase II